MVHPVLVTIKSCNGPRWVERRGESALTTGRVERSESAIFGPKEPVIQEIRVCVPPRDRPRFVDRYRGSTYGALRIKCQDRPILLSQKAAIGWNVWVTILSRDFSLRVDASGKGAISSILGVERDDRAIPVPHEAVKVIKGAGGFVASGDYAPTINAGRKGTQVQVSARDVEHNDSCLLRVYICGE